MAYQFKIQNDEKLRILNLHESATKRQYLSEQYDPTQEALVVGGGDQPAVIFNKKTKRIVRYGTNPDHTVRLDKSKPQNHIDAENLAKDPVVRCQYNILITTKQFPTEDQIQKCLANTATKQPVKTGGEKMTNPASPKSGGNSDIKKIQEKLIQLGYSVGDTRADGIMGKNTIKGILMALNNTEAINTPMTPKTINQIPTNTPEPQLKTATPATPAVPAVPATDTNYKDVNPDGTPYS